MKKSLICILSLIVVLFAVSVFAEVPAPFEKIKEIALKSPLDEQCRHMVTFDINVDGRIVSYIIVYLPTLGVTAIGKAEGTKICIIEFWEKEGKFTELTQSNNKLIRNSLSPQDACNKAFSIFKEMVGEKLI